jgi:multiple sugar transport system ATP-binding protein
MTMADKIVVLKDGLIQQIGTPLGLYNHPINRFVAGFIGSPPMNIMSVTVEDKGGKIHINEGSFTLPVEGVQADALKSYVGKTVLFGVRPEDLKLETSASAKNIIPTTVEVVEPLGAEIHLYVGTANHQMTASVDPHHQFHVGDEVRFAPDMSKVSFFDGETEKAILFNEEASKTL